MAGGVVGVFVTRLRAFWRAPVALPGPLQVYVGRFRYSVTQLLFLSVIWGFGILYPLLEYVVNGKDSFATAMSWVVKVSCMLLILPVSKNTVWGLIFDTMVFDGAILYHRWMAYWCCTAVGVHSGYWVYQVVQYFGKDLLWTETFFIYGEVAALLFAVIWTFALPIFRRRLWEAFRLAHFLWIPAMVFACMHAHRLTPFLIPGWTMLLFDYLMRLLEMRLARASCTFIPFCDGYVEWLRAREGRLRPTKKRCLRELYVLDVSLLGLAWLPSRRGASYAFVNVPGISLAQWHPFSLVPSGKRRCVRFIIKKTSSWCGQLEKFADGLTPAALASAAVGAPQDGSGVLASPPVNAELVERDDQRRKFFLAFYGCFGGVPRLSLCLTDGILLVVGGCGIVPALSVFRAVVDSGLSASRAGRPVKPICFVLGVRNDEWASALSGLFAVAGVSCDSCVELDVSLKIFIEHSEVAETAAAGEDAPQPAEVFGLPPTATILVGFPRLRPIFESQPTGHVTVVACGPQGLKEMVRKECYTHSNHERAFSYHADNHEF